MLSNNPVLPNFIKAFAFSILAAFSISVFAGHHEEAEEIIGDLKDMTSTTESNLKADEATMHKAKDSMKAKSMMLADEVDAVVDDAAEDEIATSAESINPEE